MSIFTLTGRVLGVDGTPRPNVTITLFARISLTDDEIRATTETDASGAWSIVTSPATGADSLDLFVRAEHAASQEWVDSHLISDRTIIANHSIVVDLVLGSGRFRGRSEWNRIADAVAPLLGKLAAADVPADRVEWLARRADVFPLHLGLFVQAHRLARGRPIEPSTCYALLRAGLPADLPSLLRAGASAWSAALVDAWARFVVAVPDDREAALAAALASLDELALAAALELPAVGVNRRVLLDTAGLDESEQGEFGRLWQTRQGPLVDFWASVRASAKLGPSRAAALQFTGAMTGLLLLAISISAVLGEYLDASAIAVIVVLNAIVGFVQEFRAERAVQALDMLTAPHARVIREAHTLDVAAREIVRGDVLVLEAGDIVAADARLVEAHALEVNEASLTGESIPVGKDLTPSGLDTPLAERRDRVFMGTAISRGTALAQVEAVGMATELGRIAVLLERIEIEPTPLQRRLDKVGHMLMGLAVAVVGLVAILGLVRGVGWTEVLLSSISLAVAAVPEGLAVFVTVALAIGVQRMAARNVLVRRLPAVETLGCATTICTDKTGTLTLGSMVVRRLWGPDDDALLDAAAACCDAELGDDQRTGTGDPTEIAILVAAAERGIRRSTIEHERPRVRVEPFDAETKRMVVVRGDGQTYVKGAPEAVFKLFARVEAGALEATRELAAQGLRVLAVASGATEGSLSLRGLIGLADPPRPSAIAAVADARRAGIRTVMITGDHPVTARAIAEEMGILRPGESAEELVHARATPEDKIRIVREAKARGEVVAMTGDGVNDAPALREAHIGIAMGKTGTEVARQASAMILADDDFASIIAAIREGRGIFDNIRKTLVYLLAGNIAELALVFGASMAMLPMPLLPLQILWINLVTDGLPALALTMDPTADDVLDSPPRPAQEPILGRRQWSAIAVIGLVEASIVLLVYAWTLQNSDLEHARSMAFSVLVFSEVFRALGARSPTKMLWQVGPLGNPRLLVVVVLSITVQIAVHHIPFTQRLFDIGEITTFDCILGVGLGMISLALGEIYKLWVRGSDKRSSFRGFAG